MQFKNVLHNLQKNNIKLQIIFKMYLRKKQILNYVG